MPKISDEVWELAGFVRRMTATVEEAFDSGGKWSGGAALTMMLSAAVPLWMTGFSGLTAEERQRRIKELDGSDFCLRMQYVLFRGPKEGDSARAFNDLAKAIALLSFCPGGVKVFGVRYEWKYA